MTIAALITQGIGPGGSVLYAMTGGLSIGAAPTPPAGPPYDPGFVDGGRRMTTIRGGRSLDQMTGGRGITRTTGGRSFRPSRT